MTAALDYASALDELVAAAEGLDRKDDSHKRLRAILGKFPVPGEDEPGAVETLLRAAAEALKWDSHPEMACPVVGPDGNCERCYDVRMERLQQLRKALKPFGDSFDRTTNREVIDASGIPYTDKGDALLFRVQLAGWRADFYPDTGRWQDVDTGEIYEGGAKKFLEWVDVMEALP